MPSVLSVPAIAAARLLGATLAVVLAGSLAGCAHLPYELFQYNEGGEAVGFDVDMMDLVAKELGLEQAIFDTPFGGHPIRSVAQHREERRRRRRHDHHRRASR